MTNKLQDKQVKDKIKSLKSIEKELKKQKAEAEKELIHWQDLRNEIIIGSVFLKNDFSNIEKTRQYEEKLNETYRKINALNFQIEQVENDLSQYLS